MDTVFVIPPGTRVYFQAKRKKGEHIEGWVTQVVLAHGFTISYEVAWFYDDQMQVEVVPSFMVEAAKDENDDPSVTELRVKGRKRPA